MQDIRYVKEKLAHRNIYSILIYTQLVCFDKDDHRSKTVKATKEASQLAEAGFEYVCTTSKRHNLPKAKVIKKGKLIC